MVLLLLRIAARDGRVRMRDLSTGRVQVAFAVSGCDTLAFSPDERRLAVSSHKTLCLFDSATGREVWKADLGDSAPLLREELARRKEGELRGRLSLLLESVERLLPIKSGEALRRHRAIAALEPRRAVEILERLSREAPGLRERAEARDAWRRLAVR